MSEQQTTIQVALRAAVDADQEANGISPNDLDAQHDTPRVTAVVVAFLRALPDLRIHLPGPRPLYSLHMLAAETEEAARGKQS